MIETTKYQHTHPNGEYTQSRRDLHKKIITSFIKDAPSGTEFPKAILFGGGSASGKTRIRDTYVKGTKEANHSIIIIDCDAIKEQLPEYTQMKNHSDFEVVKMAADLVHDESSDIAEEILFMCIDRRIDLMYDGTMKNFPKYKMIIDHLKQSSYTLSGIIVDVPLELAIKRAKQRSDNEQRFVPEEAIKNSHEEVAETFFRIKDDLDNYIIYDNSPDPPKPTIFASKLDGIEETHDLERLKQFYAKSGIPYYE